MSEEQISKLGIVELGSGETLYFNLRSDPQQSPVWVYTYEMDLDNLCFLFESLTVHSFYMNRET